MAKERMSKTNYSILKWMIEDDKDVSIAELASTLSKPEKTVRNWLKYETITTDKAETLLNAVNAIRSKKGLPAYNFTIEGFGLVEKQRQDICSTMTESLHAIIELLSGNATSLKTLENTAWALYRARFPRCPEFFDFAPPQCYDDTLFIHWDQPPISPDSLDKAMRHAHDEQLKHEEAAKLHEKAAIAAGDHTPRTDIAPRAYGWASYEDWNTSDSEYLEPWSIAWPEDQRNDAEYLKLEAYIKWRKTAGLDVPRDGMYLEYDPWDDSVE